MPINQIYQILLLVPLHAEKHHRSSVEEEDFVRCHMAVRDTPHMCNEYANYDQHSRERRQVEEGGEVPVDEFADLELKEGCMEMKWAEVGPDNNWGHCLETKQDDSFRSVRKVRNQISRSTFTREISSRLLSPKLLIQLFESIY